MAIGCALKILDPKSTPAKRPVREITGSNYTETCAELIITFGKALEAEQADPGNADDLANDAILLAEECGFNWEADEAFANWALKATTEESLVASLEKALATVTARLGEHLTEKKKTKKAKKGS